VGIGLGPFQRDHGVAFIGENGTMVVDRGRWEIFPETVDEGGQTRNKVPAMPVRTARSGEGGLNQHTANFIECMKTRARPKCDVEKGSLAAVTAHLGNIAFRTDGKVRWDASTMTFPGNEKANDLTKARYRAPWEVPKV
jgi:hypothetical protein